MFKSRAVFPRNTPGWAFRQDGVALERWVNRRTDEIKLNLWRRLFG